VEALTVTGAAFAGIGALLVVVGIAITRANRRFDRRALRATGQAAFIVIGGACVLLGAGLVAAGVALEDALPAVIRA
jgi:hypothetical protein